MRLARSLRPLRQGLGRVGALALLGLAARSLAAQAIGQGFELEREGQFAQAAAIYFATPRAEPTNLSALLGLGRLLPGLDRLVGLVRGAHGPPGAGPAPGLTGGAPPPLTGGLGGEWLLNGGRPERAWAVSGPSLARPSAEAALGARHFADVAAGRTTPAARRVRALALA